MDEKTANKLRRMGCNIQNDTTLVCRGKKIKISYAPKSELHPSFGRSYRDTGTVLVRDDLSPDVKRHVLIHEINHQLGQSTETGANIYSFFVDPKGWVKTASATLSDPARVKMYLKK